MEANVGFTVTNVWNEAAWNELKAPGAVEIGKFTAQQFALSLSLKAVEGRE